MTKALVASKNSVKVLAAEDALKIFCGETVMIEGSSLDIDTGVRDQPVSLIETTTGALNRLEAIKSIPGYDFYIAIEAGAYQVETPLGTMWYACACAAVVDDSASTPSLAFGPGAPLPYNLVRHLEEGKDLNDAMAIETGHQDTGKSGGFYSWFTDGNITRRSSSAEAVLVALYGLKRGGKA
ncbi:MAG: hypothetical protein JWL85_359 [Candidatus Saccharibacteria bacterium]|nr:hypothetical protein [Candidatus Saccharibacteria bacterium]